MQNVTVYVVTYIQCCSLFLVFINRSSLLYGCCVMINIFVSKYQ